MNPPTEQLVRDYLNRLSLAARGRLGLRDRQALLEQTRARIEVAVGGLREATAMQVRQALAALGDPVALVDTERARISARKEAGIGSRFEGWKNGAVPHVWPTAATAGSARGPVLAEAESAFDLRGPVAPGVSVATAVAEVAVVQEAAVSLGTRPLEANGAGHSGSGLPHRGHAEGKAGGNLEEAGGNSEAGGTEHGRAGQVDDSGPARPAAAAGPAGTAGENGSAGRAAGAGQVGGAGQAGNAGADGDPGVNGMSPETPRPRPTPPAEMITGPQLPAPRQPESLSEQRPAQLEKAAARQDASSEQTADKAVANKTAAAKIAPAKSAAAKSAAAKSAAGTTAAGKTAAGTTRTGRPGHQAGSDNQAGQDSGIELSGPAEPAGSAAGRWLAGLGSAIAARLARLGTELLTVIARDRLEAVAILLLGLGGAVYPPIWLIGVLVALSSRKWDHRDKWLGLGLPIPLVVFGATLVLLLGGQQQSMGHYASEAWLAAGRLSRIAVVLGAGYLLQRLHRYQGRRERRRPPWGPPHRRR